MENFSNPDNVEKIVKARVCRHNNLKLTSNSQEDSTENLLPKDWRKEVEGGIHPEVVQITIPLKQRSTEKILRKILPVQMVCTMAA